MIKWILTVLILFSAFAIRAQDKPVSSAAPTDTMIHTQVDQPPEFPGDLWRHIRNSIVYPAQAVSDGREDVVYVTFVVTAQGKLEGIKIKKGAYEDLNEEAIRVVKSMPQWIPAKLGGKNVAVYYTVPVRFELSD